jgi:trimeric autotransporter adhesin
MKINYSLLLKTSFANKVMMFFVVLSCLFVTNASAQIAVTVTNNTNTTPNLAPGYTSFADALTAVNAVTAMSGPITLTLAAGTETALATGLVLGSTTLNLALSATNTITIVGAGATTVLNAGTGTATPGSPVPDGILKLNGADFVTIDGLTFTDGNTTNPATMEVGIGIFKLSATDGCQNNTIQNCIFNMQRVNNAGGTGVMVDGSVAIALLNSTIAASTTALTIADPKGASSNNKFYANTINGGHYGIVIRGFATTSAFTLVDRNNDIGGSSAATGNTILNYGGATSGATNTAGIRVVEQWDFNVAYNTINNNNGGGANHPTTLRGILTSGSTSASGNINNNNITITSGAATNQMDGISNGAGGTAAANTININKNTIVFNYPTATTGTINAIINSATAATVNINDNNVSAGSVIPTTGQIVFVNGGSPTTLNIGGNTLSNIIRSGTSTGTSFITRGIVYGSPTTAIINNNTISNISYTNASTTPGQIDAIFSSTTLSVDVTISNNKINNLTTVEGNIRGINDASTINTGIKNVFNNTLHTFANTGTGGNYSGILMTSRGQNNIFKNKIYNITSTGTGVFVVGISVNGGTVSNNYIGQLYTPSATGSNAIRGIDVTGSGPAALIYNNTVRLDATSSSTSSFGTSSFFFDAAATNPIVTARNNIFVNTSTPGATSGVSAGIRRSTNGGTFNYTTSSNNNLIYVNAALGNKYLTYCEGTATIANPKNTIADFKTYTLADQQSIAENPTFVSTSGADATFLHINTATPTAIESGAQAIAAVTDDYDGDIRQGSAGYAGTGTAPDIGADEFEGTILPTCVAPTISVQPVASTAVCSGTDIVLSVTAAGTGITYQWKKSGVDIALATSSTYTITGAVAADTDSYTVLVTGTCGTKLSDTSTVTVTPISSNPTEVVTACDSYTWAVTGATYTTSGTYTSTTACVTSTLNLTITPSTSSPTEVVTACDSYTWSVTGSTYTTSGTYTSTTACVTSTLNLTITPSSSNPAEVVSACDSYTWAVTGATYTTSGTYTSTTACVTSTLNLTITPSSSNPAEVITACDSYTWATTGTTYTTSGTYTSTTACVTSTLNLTITPSSANPAEVVTACDSYTWATTGTTYTTSGTYTSTTACVTSTLNLTITPSSSNPAEVVSACDSYTWAVTGATYTTSGTYTSTTACVTSTLNLTITPSSSNPAEVVSACDSYTWATTGTTYTTSGTYTSTTACVTSTLNLTITPSSSNPAEVVTACDSYKWAVTGATYTTSGTYTSTTACVTSTLNLTITPSSSNPAEVVTACDSYTWAVTGATYTTSGTYTSTTACVTSTLNLTITPSSSNPAEVVTACDSYTWAVTGGTYTTSGTYTSTTACVTSTLNLTINSVTTPTGSATQAISGGVAADVTIEDIVVTPTTGIVWYSSSADATAGTNAIPSGTQLTNNTTYYAVSENGTCRSSALAVTVTVTLGSSSFDLSQLNYYPNPVNDIFNVKYNKEIVSVDVFDLTGRNVLNVNPNSLEVQVNMTDLSSAMYIVKLKSIDAITELKVFKK